MLHPRLLLLCLLTSPLSIFSATNRDTVNTQLIFSSSAPNISKTAAEEEGEKRALAMVKEVVKQICTGKRMEQAAIYREVVSQLETIPDAFGTECRRVAKFYLEPESATIPNQTIYTLNDAIVLVQSKIASSNNHSTAIATKILKKAYDQEYLLSADEIYKKVNEQLLGKILSGSQLSTIKHECFNAIKHCFEPRTVYASTLCSKDDVLELLPDTSPEEKIRDAIQSVGRRGAIQHGRFYQLVYRQVHPDKIKPTRFANACSQLLARLKAPTGEERAILSTNQALALVSTTTISEEDEQLNNLINTSFLAVVTTSHTAGVRATLKEWLSILARELEEGQPLASAMEKQITDLESKKSRSPANLHTSFNTAIKEAKKALLGMRIKLRKILPLYPEEDTAILTSCDDVHEAIKPLLYDARSTLYTKDLAQSVQPLSREEKAQIFAYLVNKELRDVTKMLKEQPAYARKKFMENVYPTLNAIARKDPQQVEYINLVVERIKAAEKSGELQALLNDSPATTLNESTRSITTTNKLKFPFGAINLISTVYLGHLTLKERKLASFIQGIPLNKNGQSISERLTTLTKQDGSIEASSIRKIREEFGFSSKEMHNVRRAIKTKETIATRKKAALIALTIGLIGVFAVKRRQ